jgi:membrane protein DedA with SNARE-associated domain
MQSIFHPLSIFVTTHGWLAYGALFFGVFWEGEITLIMAGILVHVGIFLWPITILVTIIAAVAKTLLGYRLGKYLGRKFPHSPILKFLERRVFYFLPRFREQPFWSIVVSKFIYGVNNATLVFAGYVGADFRKYCLAEFISSLCWLGGMYGLGLFFSTTALSISHNFRSFSLLIALFVIGFMILLKIINLIIEIIEEWGIDKAEAKKELEK